MLRFPNGQILKAFYGNSDIQVFVMKHEVCIELLIKYKKN